LPIFNFTRSVLSTSTGLFSVLAIYINRFCESFFVSNLRCTYISLYLEFTEKSVYDDFKMELTHTGDDGLSCLMVCMSTECRVFFCKFCKRFTKFALRSFCLRLDSKLDNRFREFHGFKDYRVLIVTDCISCCGEFESDRCSDISRVNFVKFCSLVGMHLKDTSNTFFFILCRVQDIRTGVHCS